MKNRVWFPLQTFSVCVLGLVLVAIVVNGKQRPLFADESPAGRSVGKYTLESLPIYRKVGPDQFKVDASAFIELAREIAVQNESHSVVFDEKTLELEVVSTPENLRRLREAVNKMYLAMGVKLEAKSLNAEQLKKLISDQNLKPGDKIQIK